MNKRSHTTGLTLFIVACFSFMFINMQAAITWTVGSYVGDGATSKAITGLAFTPDVVIVKSSNTTNPAQVKIFGMPTNESRSFTSVSAMITNGIKTLDAGGFTVGNSGNVNTSGKTYYFYAF